MHICKNIFFFSINAFWGVQTDSVVGFLGRIYFLSYKNDVIR